MCSLVYGMQTVLFILVAGRAGLGMHGYGYLFAAIGAGGLIGTSLAGRAARGCRTVRRWSRRWPWSGCRRSRCPPRTGARRRSCWRA